jgi:hypothetical protein
LRHAGRMNQRRTSQGDQRAFDSLIFFHRAG